MKKPTLDEYIAAYGSGEYPPNMYVRERGFKSCYIRMTNRLFSDGWHDPTLDLASIEARYPGKGTFTALVKRLRQQYPELTLHVESVLNLRFRSKLLALGFTQMGDGQDCFVLPPVK